MGIVNLLLSHALVVTQNDHRTIVPDGVIAIRDGRILAIGPYRELIRRYESRQEINLSGQIVFPGLINTHDHLFQASPKGLGVEPVLSMSKP